MRQLALEPLVWSIGEDKENRESRKKENREVDERCYLLWLANIIGILKRKKLLLWKEFQSGKEIYQVTESACRHLMGRNITAQGQAVLKLIVTDKKRKAFSDSNK